MHLNLEGLIPLLGGAFATAAGMGLVRVSRSPEANEVWVRQWGSKLKVVGPLVMAFGAAQLIGLLG